MFGTTRIISQDGFRCPECGGEGSIYKTVRFDENGDSIVLAIDFVCDDCDENFEIDESNSELVVIPYHCLEE